MYISSLAVIHYKAILENLFCNTNFYFWFIMSDLSKHLLHGDEAGRNGSAQGTNTAENQTRSVIIGNMGDSEPKKPIEKTQTHDPNKPESYVLAEKPMTSVMDFFETFDEFEKKHDQFSGIMYTLIGSILLGVLMSIRGEILYRLPSIEVIFSITIVTLLLNYFLLNGALYKPFIEGEENSLNAKIVGLMGIVAVVSFYYSLNFVSLHPALLFLYLGFVLVMYIEKFYSNITYTSKELSLGALALVGAYMILNVAFDSSTSTPAPQVITPVTNGTNLTNVTSDQPHELIAGMILQSVESTVENPKHKIAGIFLAAAAGVAVAFMFLITHKLKNENKTTVSYIFSLLVALFLPIFFPMQGVVKPTLGEAGWLLVAGVLGELTLLILVRASQIERTGKVGVLVLTHLVWLYIIRILFGNGLQLSGIIGCGLIVVSALYFCQEGRAIIHARKSFVERELPKKDIELKLLH